MKLTTKQIAEICNKIDAELDKEVDSVLDDGCYQRDLHIEHDDVLTVAYVSIGITTRCLSWETRFQPAEYETTVCLDVEAVEFYVDEEEVKDDAAAKEIADKFDVMYKLND